MSKKKYPEEIYPETATQTIDGPMYWISHRKDYERAYDLGYQQGQQTQGDLTGWSNLTEAIQAGERIDWDALDGLPAKCVHPELGVLTHRLERDNICSSTMPSGWYMNKSANVWKQAVSDGWYGLQGWSLWVKGDLPLRKLTADQLEPGTCFAARHNKGEYTQSYSYAQLVKADGQKPMVVCYSRYLTDIFATIDPKEVEVIDIYGEGTFEKPEGDA